MSYSSASEKGQTIPFYRPQPGQLHVYQEALERLNASIAFKGNDADVEKMVGFQRPAHNTI